MDKIDLGRSHVAIVGDFNATSPSWLPSDQYNHAGRTLEPVFLQLGLHQCINFDTHIPNDGGRGSLLDLVLVSEKSLCSRASARTPLGKSDHAIIDCTFSIQFKPTSTSQSLGQSDHVIVQCSFNAQPSTSTKTSRLRRIWNYDKADFVQVNKKLSNLDWSAVSSAADIDQAWNTWKSTFLSVSYTERGSIQGRRQGTPQTALDDTITGKAC